ncbi:hypothetical protein [Sphingomonas sp. BK235]|uniref:hypothetical protein n=1 Tax=Sphingomonas sp. BK235 TaxID=2512131 RepID=UPI0010539554|nr:hypothetical protein [Sphingomonas sp. BK235]TCP35920.1 hypothetical protein EV292_102510 [Sphingomonas sp. BK235]
MPARWDERRDQEERATIALGAMQALHDLIAFQAPGGEIKAEPFACLLQVVFDAARHAIPSGVPRHRAAVNDLEL